jgi:hypothetical protein
MPKAIKAKKRSPRGRLVKKPVAKRAKQRPIELYFWPTSNGIKISIMLEECPSRRRFSSASARALRLSSNC